VIRPALKTLLIVAATVVGVAAGVVPALAAGSYTVSACSPGATTGPWTLVNTSPGGLNAGQLCGGPASGSPPISQEPGTILYQDQGAMYAQDNLGSSTVMPNGTQAGWLFTAPASTTITAISYYRGIMTFGNSNYLSGLFQANGTPLEQCMVSTALGSPLYCSMPNSQAPVAFTGLSTSSLFFGVVCDVVVPSTSACVDGAAGQHSAQADLYSAQVTLSETALPTLGAAGGALWGGGVVSGVVPVTFSASDPSGIQGALVHSDSGVTAASVSETCDFTSAVPCPQVPSGSLSVNTTGIADGPHTFTVAATDAAGNTQSATSPSVIVDNDGPPAPSAFTATPVSSSSNAIHLAWTNPVSPPQPIASAMVQLCQATCAASAAIPAAGTGQVTAPVAGLYTVHLWLLDSQGRGSATNAATATVTVPGTGSSTPPGGGGTPPGGKPGTPPAKLHTKLTATLKGRELHVSGTLAAVATGKVKVSWRSHDLVGTLGSGSRTVAVHAHKISLTFTLSRTARSGTIGVAVRSGRRVLAGTLTKK
jgi:hypothetical protein